MQRRLRPLPFALFAAVVAVIAAAVPYYASGAIPPNMMLTYTRVTSSKMAGLPSIFGMGKGTSETETIAATRQRQDNGNTSQIVQCDLKRFVHLDNGAKTYYIVTFDQMKAAMDQAMAKYQAEAAHQTMPPQPSVSPIQGSGGITLTVNTVNDPNTQEMFGMTAHHITTTITGTENGTGQCPKGQLTMTSDEWYVPTPITFSCPFPRPSIPPMPVGNMPHGGGGNPCMGSFMAQATGKARTQDRFALKQDTTMDLGVKVTTHEEITKYQVVPYDASMFDPPAGYTQVQPPADLLSGK